MIEQYDLSYLNMSSLESKLLGLHASSHGLLTEGISSFNVGMPLFLHSQFKSLYIIIRRYVRAYCEKYDLPSLYFINSWFNVTYPGSKLKVHNHGKTGLSGALYVSAGKESVPLIFSDISIRPRPGLLIIFPSPLDHYTEKEKERRVVISFNTNYQ